MSQRLMRLGVGMVDAMRVAVAVAVSVAVAVILLVMVDGGEFSKRKVRIFCWVIRRERLLLSTILVSMPTIFCWPFNKASN